MTRPRSGEESRHGATQPEGERVAQQTKLRLLPSVRRALERRARAMGLTASAYVSALVMADVYSGLDPIGRRAELERRR